MAPVVRRCLFGRGLTDPPIVKPNICAAPHVLRFGLGPLRPLAGPFLLSSGLCREQPVCTPATGNRSTCCDYAKDRRG